MFKDSRRQDAQRTAARFDQDLQRYADKAERFFNGTVDSLDQRMAQCKRLLHGVRSAVSRLSNSDSAPYLKAAEDLNRDLRTLEAMRESMLNGASDRVDVAGLSGRRTASASPDGGLSRLAGIDQRWVTLEAARFVAANTDALAEPQELAIRAANHAELKTSTFTPARSAAVTRVFVAHVQALGKAEARRRIPQRTASAQWMPDVAPEAMFL